MKYIISLFLFFQAMNSFGQAEDIILIRHIGESDKPIPTIIIYPMEVRNSSCIHSVLDLNKMDVYLKRIVVDTGITNIFLNVIALDYSYISNNFNQKEYMFGSFEIDYYKSQDCQNQQIKIECRTKAIAFFEVLIEKIGYRNNAKDNDLIESLKSLVKRIKF